MSWSIDAIIRKENRELVRDSQNLPEVIQEVIIAAIENTSRPESTYFHVHGNGHQATGQDHETSTVTLNIKPLTSIGN